MATKAKPTEKGMDSTTTRLGRHPPRNRKTITATSRAPCQSAVVTVEAAIYRLDRRLAQIVQGPGKADAAYGVLFGPDFDELRPGRLVGRVEGLDHIADAQLVRGELIGVEADLVLLLEAAKRQDFGNALNGLERILDHPVCDLAHHDNGALPRLVDEAVIHDDAEPRGNRSHLWRAEPLGDGLAGFAEAFADDLPGKIDVCAVLEIDVDDGQAEIRGGTDLLDLRQAGHGRLDRIGQGRQLRPAGVHPQAGASG